ncbi:hypothetical protein [Tenacibaculum sp. 190524A05c]|uniref:hypothetical protein n=1 Tax=Tenacibaculum platacis TaxID=3137852 RepID=UPI0031FB3A4E
MIKVGDIVVVISENYSTNPYHFIQTIKERKVTFSSDSYFMCDGNTGVSYRQVDGKEMYTYSKGKGVAYIKDSEEYNNAIKQLLSYGESEVLKEKSLKETKIKNEIKSLERKLENIQKGEYKGLSKEGFEKFKNHFKLNNK